MKQQQISKPKPPKGKSGKQDAPTVNAQIARTWFNPEDDE